MRRFSTMCRPVVAILVMCTSVAFAADKIPAERRLPSDVVVYFSIADVAQLKSKWAESNFGKLIAQKEFAELRAEFAEPVGEAKEKVAAGLGVTLDEILAIPQGEIAFAVIQSGGKPISAVMLLDFGENGATVEKLREKADAALQDQGATRSEEDFEDTQIVTYEIPKDEEDAVAAAAGNLVVCVKDQTIMIANRAEAVKSILTRWDGKQDRTFSENATFSYLKERCNGDAQGTPVMTWFIDPISMVKGVIQTSMKGSLEAAMALGMLPTLGVDRFRGIGGTVDMAQGDYDSISRTLVYMEAPRRGVLNMFEFPAKTQEPPKWVSAAATTYVEVNWDIVKAFDAGVSIYETFAGPGAVSALLDELAEDESGPMVHIKKDILDQLSGTIQVVGQPSAQSDENDGFAMESYVFAIGVKDEAAMKKSLTKIAAVEGFPGKSREFRGATIYEIPSPTSDVAPAFTVQNRQLVIATSVASLEEILRADPDQESLVDSPSYKQVAKRFPQQTSSIGYQRADAQLRTIYEAIRTGQADEFVGEIPFDLSKLPPFEVVKPYLTPSGSYMAPDERGLLMINFSLKENK